ncbi:phosphoglycerate mutase [Mycoplasma sp. CAG:776]|nr:phosphoglycerate mutase [Mycoplasma sp. CAG:776]
MTTIYLINNSLTMNNLSFPDKELLEQKREKRILSIEGEEASKKLVHDKDLQSVQYIYSSSYVMSIGTAKYLAKKLELDINIKAEIGERVLGNLGDKKIRMVTEIQENDFDYKLSGGESLNEVKKRMYHFISKLLEEHQDKVIALFTHNVAITCLLSHWCTKGFNLDNRLILNYQEEAIIDGTWDGVNIIELVFDKKELVSIKRKK